MKIFTAAGGMIAVFGLFGAASAADMPTIQPINKAASVKIKTWSGFYIGGDLGAAFARQSASAAGLPSPGWGAPAIPGGGIGAIGLAPTSHDQNSNGIIGGLYTGYNWQLHPIWVAGIEADFSWFRRNVSNTQSELPTFPGAVPGNGTMMLSSSNSWLASVRGRIGRLTLDNSLLIYATGGAAWTNTNYIMAFNKGTTGDLSLAPVLAQSSSFSQTRTGFAVGGGGEWMFSPNWTLRAEYIFYGFSGSNTTIQVGGPGVCTGGCSFSGSWNTLNLHTIRAGLAYNF